MVQSRTSRRLNPLDELVGTSDWAERIRREVPLVGAHPADVLIAGPSGTGKELIARAIHVHSERGDGPFVPVNCAAITGTLFESHMFGHVKGAFTDAHYSSLGCFRAADGGTLFLDEVGELDAQVQAKLLRVLQERAVAPVGSQQEVPVDVRLVAATNRDLKQEVAAGRFREDLYFRVNVISLKTAPLCDRPEDIEPIANRYLAQLAVRHGLELKSLSLEAMGEFRSHTWPGNVRELQNVIQRCVLFSRGEVIDGNDVQRSIDEVGLASGAQIVAIPSDLPTTADDQRGASRNAAGPSPATDENPWLPMDDVECEHIRRTLQHAYGNQSAAARLLGRDRQWLIRRIKRYGLDVKESRLGRPRKSR